MGGADPWKELTSWEALTPWQALTPWEKLAHCGARSVTQTTHCDA
jgi:hypothetical protein